MPWAPPPWLDLLFRGVRWVLMSVGALAMLAGCFALAHVVTSSLEPFLVMLLFPLAALVTVAIHEGGHVLAGRAIGMTVYRVHVGPLQLLARRRGWRIRWQRQRPGDNAGSVIAVPNPYAAVRRQYLLLIAGGPLANLLTAAGCGLLAWRLGLGSTSGAFCTGAAAFNLAVGLGNLVPLQSALGGSDGLKLLEHARRRDPDALSDVLAELNGLSLRGVTADKLPAHRLALLADGDGWFFYVWFTLKAMQNRGEWTQVAALQPDFEAQVATLPAPVAESWHTMIALLRCELAFSRAIAGEDTADPLDAALTADLDWAVPALRPRCQALMAARRGDQRAALVALARAEALAENDVDAATRQCERGLREAIRQRLPVASVR
ncbi:M50 family metallopeptidase [Xanthomonas sacchari]|uniref:Peptidase M50 domain-containing protein n=1 Tax=Xanthomonas sacchari TaxID=56458 RepID=A0A2P5Z839_9XANT|nr:M50 family metallopeptidase [Xanthomonas sacchari]MDV0436999.1 M50 family metallopeptidase [Xanthomonas sacchari]PPU84627.1 hypothetical protein XsacCFBP4641_02190 [Xanthomonas sacchari]